MRIAEHVDVSATPADVWRVVTDPTRALAYLRGVTRWEVDGDRPNGLGARYRMLMRVGSAEIGSLIEVVEFDVERDMAWSSVTGVPQRGRWRLREVPTSGELPRTRVELRLQYVVAGAGMTGWLAERVAGPMVGRNVRNSLVQLKRQVEHERLRADAAARRAGQMVA